VSVDHPAADKSYIAVNENADSQCAIDSGNTEDTDRGSTS